MSLPHRHLAGRPVLVMGLGRFGGGLGAARYLARLGARVTATDLQGPDELAEGVASLRELPVELALGGHRERDFDATELVVANPAVPPQSPWLARARAAGARITTASTLFLEAVPATVLAVTGTQGKSTTCHLLHQLLEAGGRCSYLGGNIGGSLFDVLEAMTPADAVVLELSSYQLEALPDPAPPPRAADSVAIVNVLADHLERHGSPEAYARAKARLLELVGAEGVALLPDRGTGSSWMPPRGRSLSVQSRAEGTEARTPRPELAIAAGRFVQDGADLGAVADLQLPGAFQRTNALFALGLARAAGLEPATLAAALPGLRGLPHRLERCESPGGVVWDNGVSTTPDSTASALEALDGPLVLLLGGLLKELPLEPLLQAARGRVRAAVTFGEDGARLARSLAEAGIPCRYGGAFEDATRAALEARAPGEALLFSPACASFDAFPNFLERARLFRALLEESGAPAPR